MGIKGVLTGGDYGPTPDGGRPSGHAGAGGRPPADDAEVSALARALSAIQELQLLDPPRFRQVAASAGARLRREAAEVAGDAGQAAVLAHLAEGFERAARDGTLPPALPTEPHPPPPGPAAHGLQSYGAAPGAAPRDPMHGLSSRVAQILQAALRGAGAGA
jgi:hypothetical protein